MIRRLLAVAAMAVACVAHAQDYPSKPIRIIIPSTPGGGTDYIGRLMGNKLHELNGWSVVPENKPGAGTALDLPRRRARRRRAMTSVIGQSDNVTLIPLLMKVAYDPVKRPRRRWRWWRPRRWCCWCPTARPSRPCRR